MIILIRANVIVIVIQFYHTYIHFGEIHSILEEGCIAVLSFMFRVSMLITSKELSYDNSLLQVMKYKKLVIVEYLSKSTKLPI